MSWVGVAVGVAGTVIGGAVQSDSSRRASNTQADAAREATDLQREIYDSTVERNRPFVQGGTTAFNALLQRLGLSGDPNSPGYGELGKLERFDGGPAFTAPTSGQVMSEPGYQFGLQQGQNALDRRGAARGTNYSGAALAEAARYAGDYATGRYGDAFTRALQGHQQGFNERLSTFQQNAAERQNLYNRFMGPVQIGQGSAAGTAAAGSQFGTAAGGNMTGAANAQAANALAQGNIWANVLNQGASAYGRARQPGTAAGAGWSGWGGSAEDPWYG